MNDIIAIDPGTTETAYLRWNGKAVAFSAIEPNTVVLDWLRHISVEPLIIAVEMVACYGMPVGKEVFETCLMIGRIQEICCLRGYECRLVYRLQVKTHHCKSAKAKDSNIRQALVDKYGAPGTKKAPGATYGIKSHLWSALAIATYITETNPL